MIRVVPFSVPAGGAGRVGVLGLSRRWAPALGGALAVLCVAAAACGGDGASRVEAVGSEDAAAVLVASSGFLSSRPGAGIAAAGGNPHAVRGPNPCEQPGSAAADPIIIAYVGADLASLDAVGLEGIVVEEPGLVISAYVNEVNFNGGINGRCVEFASYLWSLADPVSSFTRICADLPQQEPVFYFTLVVYDAILDCATIGAQIPAIGLYSSVPEAVFVRTRDLLYIDDGSVERLLDRSLDVAIGSGVIGGGDRVGLLHGSGPSAGMGPLVSGAIIRSFRLDHADTVLVPAQYASLELLLEEKRVRLLETGLSAGERAEAERNRAALAPGLAALFAEMEQFYTETAAHFEALGVTVVVATVDWSDLRRMMRAAESIGWVPKWVASDIQPSTVLLADAPRRQAQNLVQVSSRRAAGDEVPALDRGCITVRNAASDAAPFAHRLHSDAWNLITATCDYLDVAFSALTRAGGPITARSFVRALNDTRYETGHGGLITLSPANRNGAESFRVLQADPDCVLNFWGCMRSTTDWLLPGGSGSG